MTDRIAEVPTRLAWLRLNADGLLIALLGLVFGLFDILIPNHQALEAEIGHEPVTYWIWNGLYLIGGLVMLWGFFRQQIGPELLGRLFIGMGITVEMLRIGSAFGWHSEEVWSRYALWLIIAGLFTLRATALLAPRGVVVVVNGHTNFTDEVSEELDE